MSSKVKELVGPLILVATLFAHAQSTEAQTVWLDELDLSHMDAGWGSSQARKSVDGNPLSIAGQKFERGVGTHAVSTLLINLHGKGRRFAASVGVDDETGEKGSVSFYVLGDKRILWQSGIMRKGEPVKKFDLPITGVRMLGLLITDADDGISYDHADWCDARLELAEPVSPSQMIVDFMDRTPYVLTPRPAETPRINGARVFGVRPGNPFLYTIAASGKRPMKFKAEGLPLGLTLDESTGRITGSVNTRGQYRVRLSARNELGQAERELLIVVGDTICLTPPMGWNSWNCWGCAVDDEKVRAAADAMVSTGLVHHGWTYINIDDCWEIKPETTDPNLSGEARDASGMINTNKKFPDMKALSDYVHARGLKLGIYSSPGPLTCAEFTGSYQHEEKDAQRYADWGIDYLKYDWCSYGRIAKDRSLPELKKPYIVMREALNKVPRDIVYSLCQYGMGNVWEWGAEVGGNCWRTTGDIVDTWQSMSRIGFGQAGLEKHAGPGHWNDPDMLVIGLVGWGANLHPTRLTPDEQYTHISLWSLLAAPLLIGCDLTKLDEFTLNLLTNDEVLSVNQDPLGKQAKRVFNEDGKQIWVKELADGSKAVGFFFADQEGKRAPADYFLWEKKGNAQIPLKVTELGISGRCRVRDLWRQKDLGVFDGEFVAEVSYHGVALVRISQE